MKITNEIKNTVIEMFNNGVSQRGIAEKCGISPRSVGRIIDNANKDNEEIHVKLADIRTLGDVFGTAVKTAPETINPNAKGCVVQEDVRRVMEYVRREIKGVEGLTYLIESSDTPNNLENYRKALVNKLRNIKWWAMDVEGIQLGVHHITEKERKAIGKGEYGIN